MNEFTAGFRSMFVEYHDTYVEIRSKIEYIVHADLYQQQDRYWLNQRSLQYRQ